MMFLAIGPCLPSELPHQKLGSSLRLCRSTVPNMAETGLFTHNTTGPEEAGKHGTEGTRKHTQEGIFEADRPRRRAGDWVRRVC